MAATESIARVRRGQPAGEIVVSRSRGQSQSHQSQEVAWRKRQLAQEDTGWRKRQAMESVARRRRLVRRRTSCARGRRRTSCTRGATHNGRHAQGWAAGRRPSQSQEQAAGDSDGLASAHLWAVLRVRQAPSGCKMQTTAESSQAPGDNLAPEAQVESAARDSRSARAATQEQATTPFARATRNDIGAMVSSDVNWDSASTLLGPRVRRGVNRTRQPQLSHGTGS